MSNVGQSVWSQYAQAEHDLAFSFDQLLSVLYQGDESEIVEETIDPVPQHSTPLTIDIHPAFNEQLGGYGEIRPSRPRDLCFTSSQPHPVSLTAVASTQTMHRAGQQDQTPHYNPYLTVNDLAYSFYTSIDDVCSDVDVSQAPESAHPFPLHDPVHQSQRSSYSELSANLEFFNPAVTQEMSGFGPNEQESLFCPTYDLSLPLPAATPPRPPSSSKSFGVKSNDHLPSRGEFWPSDADPPFLWPATTSPPPSSLYNESANPSNRPQPLRRLAPANRRPKYPRRSESQRRTSGSIRQQTTRPRPPLQAHPSSSSLASSIWITSSTPSKSKRASEVLKNILDPKKPKLACLFCRERKIACGPLSATAEHQSQCNQCVKRGLRCIYPKECRRGIRGSRNPSAKGPNPPIEAKSQAQV